MSTFFLQAVDGATRYRLRVYDKVTGANVYLENVESTAVCTTGTCAFTPPITLNVGTNHFWRLRAWNAEGWGDWTAVTRFDLPPPAPAVPTLVSPLATVDTATPTFTWQPSDHATRYRLHVYDSVLGQAVHLVSHEAIDDCSGNSCSVTPAITLNEGGNHFWRVRPWNAAGWGEWSAKVYIDYVQSTAPVELTEGQPVSGTLAQGEWQHYTLTSTAATAQTLSVTLTGLADDADLFLRVGQTPDTQTFDCKSDNGGTANELCVVSFEPNTVLHISVNGFAATPYTLQAGGQ